MSHFTPNHLSHFTPMPYFWGKGHILAIQTNLQLTSITWIYMLVVQQHVWHNIFYLNQIVLTQQLIKLTARFFTFACKKHIFVKKTCLPQQHEVQHFMARVKLKGLENIMVKWPQMCSIAYIMGVYHFTLCITLPHSLYLYASYRPFQLTTFFFFSVKVLGLSVKGPLLS